MSQPRGLFAKLVVVTLVGVLVLPVVPPTPAAAQLVTLSGWFLVDWGDPDIGARGLTRYELIDDAGQGFELQIDPSVLSAAGGALALDGRRVTLTGQAVSSFTGDSSIQVDTIQLDASATQGVVAQAAVSGQRPWLTILCRFADSTGYTPFDPAHYEGLMGVAAPGMDHYWREQSYGQINLAGSVVVGWYNLPHPHDYYVRDTDGDGDRDHARRTRLFRDCVDTARNDVDVTAFIGVNLMFNENLDCDGGTCWSWGGRRVLPIVVCSGTGECFVTYQGYAVTWMALWAHSWPAILAHEMGHGFGLDHSSGPYDATYDSGWDVMSGGRYCATPPDPRYYCPGPHTIAYHKDRLGWVPSSQKYVAQRGTTRLIALHPLGQPTTGYLMAQIPLPGSPFYTVELRRPAGDYEINLPGDGVVMHQVIPGLDDRQAQVVDPDGNNPNDAAAVLTEGEEFVDWGNRIVVAVEAMSATWAAVRIAYDPPDLVVPSLSAPTAAAAGTTILVSDTTWNQDGSKAAATTTRFYLSTNAAVDSGDVPLGGRPIPELGSGASSSGSTSVSVPLNTPVGTYYIIARADDAGAVFEMLESNNLRVTPISIRPAADLAVTVTDSPDPVWVGDTLTYTVKVTNRGPATATGVVLTDTPSPNFSVLSVKTTRGSCVRSGSITCSVGTLASGATAQVTIVGVPKGSTKVLTESWKISNSATVTSNDYDPFTANNKAVALTTVYDF